MQPCKTIITVLLLMFYLQASAGALPTVESIRINQLGYYIYAPKIAVITAPVNSTAFYIIDATTNNKVYNGTLSKEISSAYSSLKTRIADFSSVKKPGTYIIEIPGLGSSYQFIIGSNVQHDVAAASLKGFYYIRSSIPLEQAFAGSWARPAGHPDTVVLVHPSAADGKRQALAVISTPGGWYDAGDYNKYIVNSGITMGTLLSAWEDFKPYFDTLNTNIPESTDAIPDILNETIYNLRWMLTMQDPNDGGVYHKCTNAAFDGMVMPGVTTLPRYVVAKGTAATLDFAAVTAQAARILQQYNKALPGLSDSCLRAAKLAWQWALQHPAVAYNQDALNKVYQPSVTTGAYGDNRFADEWFWSACELYTTTKDNQYYDTLQKYVAAPFTLPSWGNVHSLGLYTLMRMGKVNTSGNSYELAQHLILTYADTLIANGGNKAFATIMGQSQRDFNWGSSSNAANQGIVLINAYLITGNKKYINAALSNLDYLLGRNATGYCFVTGIGSKSTMHPHHRPSVADGIEAPVPGLLAGGPNAAMQDKCHYDFTETETAYSDTDCAYASNEIAINWNAPLVYLSNAIEALQQKAGWSSGK